MPIGTSQPSAPAALPASKPRRAVLLALMAVVTLAVVAAHWPALSSNAVCIDDPMFFTTNPLVQNPSFESVRRFITEVRQPSTVQGYYQPLTMISLMADRAMGASATNMTIAHVDSLVLHVLTTLCILLLVYVLFRSAWVAAIGAMLFGMHPLTVELVVWLGQRKAVLAGLFTAACLLCFVMWVKRRERGGPARGGTGWYVASLIALALGLLSKPSALPAPLLLLTLDFWPLRRLGRRAVVEKIPHFVITLIAGVISVISHIPTVGLSANANLSFLEKALVACSKIGYFVEKVLLPSDLSVYYAIPLARLSEPLILQGVVITAALVLTSLIALRWTRAPAASFGFFVLGLGPVLGFIGYSEVYVFDNYVYISLFGLVLLLAGGLVRIGFGDARRPIALAVTAVLAALIGGAYAAYNWSYLRHWSDTESLYAYMIRRLPLAPLLHMNLGNHYLDRGDLPEAKREYERAIELNPNAWDANFNMALLLRKEGKNEEALRYLQTALRHNPQSTTVRRELGLALLAAGRADEAAPHLAAGLEPGATDILSLRSLAEARARSGQLAEAVKIWQSILAKSPDLAEVHSDLAVALGMLGRGEEALPEIRRAIALEPGRAPFHSTLGMLLSAKGQLDDAAASLTRALELDSSFLPAMEQLAIVRVRQQRPDDAKALADRMLQVNPRSVTALVLLGDISRFRGDVTQAMEAYRRAIEADPNNPAGHFALGMALRATGQLDEARHELQEALRLNPAHNGARAALQQMP